MLTLWNIASSTLALCTDGHCCLSCWSASRCLSNFALSMALRTVPSLTPSFVATAELAICAKGVLPLLTSFLTQATNAALAHCSVFGLQLPRRIARSDGQLSSVASNGQEQVRLTCVCAGSCCKAAPNSRRQTRPREFLDAHSRRRFSGLSSPNPTRCRRGGLWGASRRLRLSCPLLGRIDCQQNQGIAAAWRQEAHGGLGANRLRRRAKAQIGAFCRKCAQFVASQCDSGGLAAGWPKRRRKQAHNAHRIGVLLAAHCRTFPSA